MTDVIEDGARGVAFEVPQDHTVKYDADLGQVTLTAPRGGTTFGVKRVERRDDETVYVVGERIAHDDKLGPYPEPLPPEEIDRLEEAIRAARETPTAWAEGEGYIEHITRLRRQLRDLRRAR